MDRIHRICPFRSSDIKNKVDHHYNTAVVLGGGVSGVAAARNLMALGLDVVLVDEQGHESSALNKLQAQGVQMVTSAPPKEVGFDVCVTSPGFAADHPILTDYRVRGIPVFSEMEWGWQQFPGQSIGVTGTNGKSTTVKFIVDVLNQFGVDAVACGNYGVPVCDALEAEAEFLVIEASSFQLEQAVAFAPERALLLNIQQDHLDRHGDMAAYAAAKIKLFESGGARLKVLPANCWEWVTGAEEGWTLFGTSAQDHWWYDGQWVRQGERPVVDLADTRFGNEIWGPQMAGILAVLDDMLDGSDPNWRELIERFRPIPHRMERIGEIRGVLYINDSKATNLAALYAGVCQARRPVHLLAGGRMKEPIPDGVPQDWEKRVRKVYAFGESGKELAFRWGERVAIEVCDTLDKAFQKAHSAARSGEAILLSPGAASFDQFRDYEERGKSFRFLVEEYMDLIVERTH